jgi:hypothetical protein
MNANQLMLRGGMPHMHASQQMFSQQMQMMMQFMQTMMSNRQDNQPDLNMSYPGPRGAQRSFAALSGTDALSLKRSRILEPPEENPPHSAHFLQRATSAHKISKKMPSTAINNLKYRLPANHNC